MVDKKYLLSDVTEQVIGCAMRVHSSLGNGFPEIIYQRALALELEASGITFGRETEHPIYSRDVRIGSRIVDFLIQDNLLLELKATSELTDTHFAQIINYLTAFKLEVGLLINFGQKSLQYRRFIKTRK